MSFLLGLTGSIGTGKTTTADMFREEGIPVWDADSVVHRLYAAGGAAVPLIAQEFPAVIEDGAVSRAQLRDVVTRDKDALSRIEAIVHPMVAADRARFLDDIQNDIAVFDIPLLFEAGYDTWLDAVICVTVPAEVQRERVLSRPGITTEAFEAILAKQMPDAQKRARADYVVETLNLDDTRAAVRRIIASIREKLSHA